ncbi:MAG TPA: ATP-binding protein [Gemmatimonadales bacterium]|nr:ATP-binding protein [Gemmatimonadales bacterium]
MSDPIATLLAAAERADGVPAFWKTTAQSLEAELKAPVRLTYRGLNDSGEITAGAFTTGTSSVAITDADGRRVEAFAGRPLTDADVTGVHNILINANHLAVMVGKRIALERERRLGTFIVELSRWLFAAPETELLLRYTMQGVTSLIDAQGGYVALREAPGRSAPDAVTVVTAIGMAHDFEGRVLNLEQSTTGRVVRTGEAVITTDATAEPDASPPDWTNADRVRSALIAPLHTSSGVVGAIGVIRFRGADGEKNPHPFTITDLHYFTAVAAQIAGGLELSQAVAAARAAANRAGAMVNASPLPLALVDPLGRVQQLNEAGRAVFGLASDSAAIGKHLDGLGLSTSELPLHSILAGRKDGEPWNGRVVVSQPGGDRRLCDCTITNLTGLGSPHLLVALYDRTDELRTQRELIAREKLATVGEIAGGVAHEVNNPLAAIRMEAELLGRGSSDPEVGAAASTIVREVDRAARIVRSLLRLARRADSTPVRVNINELIKDVAEIRQRVLRAENIEVMTVLEPDSPVVLGLGQELQQVVINLVTNAEYSARGGTRSPAMVRVTSQERGGWVRLTVDDSGPGVPPAIRHRIFDPFFTTKGPDEGSGLGLSICQRVVAEVGGKIWLEESDLGGARFVVELPAAPESGDRVV